MQIRLTTVFRTTLVATLFMFGITSVVASGETEFRLSGRVVDKPVSRMLKQFTPNRRSVTGVAARFGYGSGNSYNPGNNYNPDNNYNSGNNYDSGNNYNSDNNYNSGKGNHGGKKHDGDSNHHSGSGSSDHLDSNPDYHVEFDIPNLPSIPTFTTSENDGGNKGYGNVPSSGSSNGSNGPSYTGGSGYDHTPTIDNTYSPPPPPKPSSWATSGYGSSGSNNRPYNRLSY